MAITSIQTKRIHLARKRVGWNEAQYRTALRNAAGAESSKQIDQAGFENMMALLEDCGFADDRHAPGYWRDRVAARGSVCGPRMLWKIEQLAPKRRYALAALCERFSDGRTDQPRKLAPREAWKLIDMLQAVIERESGAGSNGGQAAESVAPERTVEPASTPV